MRQPAALALALAALLLQGCERGPERTIVYGPKPPAAVEEAAPSVEPAVRAAAPASTPAASAPQVAQAPAPPPAQAPAAPPAQAPAPPPAQAPAPPPAQAPAPARGGAAGVIDPGDREGARLLAERTLVVPVAGIAPGALSDHYRLARGKRVHEAIDIMAAAGTPVVAVEDGRVAKLFTSRGGGLTIYHFDPHERLAYYYAHLQAYAPGLREGKKVRRGDVIGYVGSSGNANPAAPHLHFAVFRLGPQRNWWQGEAVNPYPALRRAQPVEMVAAGR